jgi:hypothetical protein
MSCRRVLSSTPLLVRGSETGGEGNRNLQTRTYKQEIHLYKLLESDKQVVGPVSTQAPLDWRQSLPARR